MILLLVFGLIGLVAPGWFMACIGIASNLEDDPGLVWFFRIVGGIMAGIAIYYLVSHALSPPRG
jgi:hypothetical protein